MPLTIPTMSHCLQKDIIGLSLVWLHFVQYALCQLSPWYRRWNSPTARWPFQIGLANSFLVYESPWREYSNMNGFKIIGTIVLRVWMRELPKRCAWTCSISWQFQSLSARHLSKKFQRKLSPPRGRLSHLIHCQWLFFSWRRGNWQGRRTARRIGPQCNGRTWVSPGFDAGYTHCNAQSFIENNQFRSNQRKVACTYRCFHND